MNPNQPYKNYKSYPNNCIDLIINKCNEKEIIKFMLKKYCDFHFIMNQLK